MDVLHSSMYLQWANPPASDKFFNYVKEKGFKKSFKKGTTILHEGEIVQHGYYIVEGWIALCFSNPTGDPRIAMIIGPKRPFGIAPVLDQVPIPLSFKAIRDCEFYVVSRDALIQGMREDIDLNLEMFAGIFAKCKSAYQKINLATYFPSEKKLVFFFITLLQYMEYREAREWYELPINLSHTQIAQLIGLSRVTVCNIFNKYRAEGEIRYSPKKLFVSNRLINDEYVKLFLET